MKTQKEVNNYSIAETPLTLTASQEAVYYYCFLYLCFKICRINVSPLAFNFTVSFSVLKTICYSASTMPLLGAVEPDKEAPYQAGLLGLCSS